MHDFLARGIKTSNQLTKKEKEIKKQSLNFKKYFGYFKKTIENKIEKRITQKDFDKMWKMVWRNIREENPSMRLTKGGYQFLKKNIQLKDYMVKLKRECKLNPEILLGLDKFITCPYYITNKEIYVFEEKLASELVLRAGDLDILIVGSS